MGELTTGVSWLAVIVGAVVSFLVGWLWYSPKLFGPKWAEGVGVKMGTAKGFRVRPHVRFGQVEYVSVLFFDSPVILAKELAEEQTLIKKPPAKHAEALGRLPTKAR